MYIVTKRIGTDSPVSIENTDTKVSIVIGTMYNKPMIKTILADYIPDIESYESRNNAWHIEVNKETAEALAKLTIPMKKPIRNQKKQQPTNTEIPNALDIMLGLASYNKGGN